MKPQSAKLDINSNSFIIFTKWLDHNLLNHSSTDEHSCYFMLLSPSKNGVVGGKKKQKKTPLC